MTGPAEVAAALRRAGLTDLSDSTLRRALYSSDASLYRVVPAVVAHPRDADEVAAALDVCTTLGVPLTCRGAGTSIAGNAVGTGLILDFSRNMAAIVGLDPEAAAATVQPGVVQARLQRAAAPHGLRFGPDPSTHDRCTIGGMIGNNSCGSRSLQYGRTVDNVLALDVLTGTGRRLRLTGPAGRDQAPEPGGPRDPQLAALGDVVAGDLATIRTEFGRFGRQVSGYALEHLLPEHGFDVRRALVGSEGTLAIVTGATVALVRDPPHKVLVVLGFPDMIAAADATPAILPLRPTTCEGMDSRLVDVVARRRGAGRVPDLPPGSGWLFVEVTGDSPAEALSQARQVLKTPGALSGLIVTDAAHAAALWSIREQGAGLAGRTVDGTPAYPGWEDSAVPPQALGPYLRDLTALLAEYRLSGIPYGHFGDGCVHLRLDFPLDRPDGSAELRGFLEQAAALVTRYGGSLSGEHGDGRCRSELLPVMYSPAAMTLFGQVKDVFDPGDVLNPGVLVRPRPLDADVRATELRSGRAARLAATPLALSYPGDGGDFSAAVHRCTGVGKCVASTAGTSRVMCPSFQATGDEKDSTRGRARVLEEMVNGTLVTGGWRAREVREALDLCLSCKACSSECPAGVDMATYKSEVLHQAYRRRLRPRSHYALGQLPRWARLAARAPRAANAALTLPGLGRAARLAAGIDQRRSLPPFAAESFRAWYRREQAGTGPAAPGGTPVVLMVDTFTDYFTPQVGRAALRLLTDAGFRVTIPDRPTCCAITWISTGQLGAARRILRRTVAELSPAVRAGVPVVGLEPSCTATLRSDAVDLLETTEARALADSVATLSELLATAGDWTPPALDGTAVVAQPHCHHSAVLGWDADAALLKRAGADLTRLGGCCGLAGNFGMERGHYEVSTAVAGTALLPALGSAGPDAVVLTDGFSCRTQVGDLTGRTSQHLAELLAGRLTDSRPAAGHLTES